MLLSLKDLTGVFVVKFFCGSGITLVASILEGWCTIGFEGSEEYCEIAARRLEAAQRGELLKFVKGL